MENLNVVEILKLGITGLVFLLAFLSYRLLTQEQEKEKTRENILNAIDRFMKISIVLSILVGVFGVVDYLLKNIAIESNATSFITGTFENLKVNEEIFSPDLFLKESSKVGEMVDYEWILPKSKNLGGEDKIKIYLIFKLENAKEGGPVQEIELKKIQSQAKVRIIFDRNDGLLKYYYNNEPLPFFSGLDRRNVNFFSKIFSIFTTTEAIAQESNISSEEVKLIRLNLESDDPAIRDSAINELVRRGVSSMQFINDITNNEHSSYRLKLGVLKILNQFDKKTFDKIKDDSLVNEESFKLIAAWIGDDDEFLKKEAKQFIINYNLIKFEAYVQELIQKNSSQDRILAINILRYYGGEYSLTILKNRRKSEIDGEIIKELDITIENLDNKWLSGKIDQLTSVNKKKALKLAFELKSKNIPFKWGGKNEEGFDSSGFPAYILNKAGLLNNYQNYWSGRLRDIFKPSNAIQTGDLVFYEYGYVMIYLWDNRVIGMTPSGIIIQNIDFGPKRLGYGNVIYDK